MSSSVAWAPSFNVTHTTTLPFFRDFDIVSLFDVIEHIDDDVTAVSNAASVLRPSGFVVITANQTTYGCPVMDCP